jgi:hypothetical protein
VYEKSLNPSNLRAAFKKTGIYPLSPNESDIASSVPSVVYKGKSFLQSQLNTIHDSNENNNTDNNDTIEKRADESIFCIKRGGYNVLKAVTAAKKPRRNIRTVVGGKAITESDTFAKV